MLEVHGFCGYLLVQQMCHVAVLLELGVGIPEQSLPPLLSVGRNLCAQLFFFWLLCIDREDIIDTWRSACCSGYDGIVAQGGEIEHSDGGSGNAKF